MQSGKGKVIYLRRKNRAAYALSLKKGVSLRSLEAVLAKRESIQPENIILIHRGKVLDSALSLIEASAIEDKSIIHVIDLLQVKKETINIHVKGLNNAQQTLMVSSEMKVKDLIQSRLARIHQLPHFYIGLVYAGHMLSPQKTLSEQYVEDDCQIIAVNILQYITQKKTEKGLKHHPQQQNQEDKEKKKSVNEEISPIKDEEKAGIIGINEILIEQSSNTPENHSETPAKPTSQDHTLELPQQTPNLQTAIDEAADNGDKQIEEFVEENLKDIEPPPFNIQVSQVESVDSEQGQHNHVHFYQEEEPFEDVPTSTNPQSLHQITKEKLGESVLAAGEYILSGGQFESQTKSFIQKLMKKYKIMFQ